MEESSSVREKESCGDRVRHDEAEIWREPEFERGDGAAKRAVDQGGLAQHRTTELPGVCREVTFSTGPNIGQELYHKNSDFCGSDGLVQWGLNFKDGVKQLWQLMK